VQRVDGGLHWRRGDVGGLDDHGGWHLGAGEGRLDAVVGLDDGQVLGQHLGGAQRLGLEVEGRQGQDREHQSCAHGREQRSPQDRADHACPDAAAALAAPLQPAAKERDAALVDAVAELGQQRGQDGERADHGDQDDQHGAHRDRGQDAVAGQ
jgi:hypothetical protein